MHFLSRSADELSNHSQQDIFYFAYSLESEFEVHSIHPKVKERILRSKSMVIGRFLS